MRDGYTMCTTHTAFAVDFLDWVWLRPLHVWKQKCTHSWVFKTHQILSSLAPLIIRRVGFHNHSLWVQESALSFILEMWVMINIEPFVCTMYIVQSKYIKGIGKAIPTNFHSAEHCIDDSSQCNMLSSDESSCYYHVIWCIMISSTWMISSEFNKQKKEFGSILKLKDRGRFYSSSWITSRQMSKKNMIRFVQI